MRISIRNITKYFSDSSMIVIKRTRGELKKIIYIESKIKISSSNKMHESTNYLLIKILMKKKFIIISIMKLKFQINWS